ncbi:hypothetical protein G6F45_004963 [Rhizopus arrhizus]|nr:hypothetical protein G6F45_004963 [Rhizopus arrhizus]
MHGESASVDISSENIQNELRKIEELLEPYDPVDIMNFDETSQPIVIAQDKSPKCFKARANLLSMIAVGKNHEIEYHYSTNAWMTTYVKKLNVAFGRQNRKIALLLDNASVHKIRIPLNNIKLLFLPANTTSKLQVLDAGIIDNFKAHFRAQQYDRALCLYITNAWLKLNLEADESEMIVCYTTSTTNNEETAEGNIDETEENDNTKQDEQRVDVVECRKRLREAYETIFMYKVPLDDLDRTMAGHYLSFLKAILDEMDKYPEMKGHYLVMDNAPIHSSTDIGKYIRSRGYRYAYLPPYSPELNPIEQLWPVVKMRHVMAYK